MILAAITGGVAAGKTTVGKLFQEWGARLIEADGIGWELLRDEGIKDRLVRTHGNEILGPQGDIDRRILGRIVFSSRDAREKLNSIVHPRLLGTLKEKIEEIRKTGFEGVVAVVAALIPEWGIGDWFDKLIVVTCPEEQALKRLMDQGFAEREAKQRIGSQLPPEEKTGGADFVIINSGDREELRIKARAIWEEITQFRTPSS